ncbi:MAG: MFS transporter, partial [Rhodobacteraceae bacterium]|nr:MFS transporter [Paracoccaceae bacterium]
MYLSWLQIVRLGLVQMALGAIVVLMTSTLNRLMSVELALPVILPGFLVALHYGVQITRPGWGFLSDTGGKRTRWIIGGMAILGMGALMATGSLRLFQDSFSMGLAASILAYALIGIGVGASGTSLLALLATATAPHRRAAAATITWLMMIFGLAVTAGTTGAFIEPFSHDRIFVIVSVVSGGALLLTALAIWGIEARVIAQTEPRDMPLVEGLAEVWAEPKARHFTLFIFLSMTAYFMQELILEPYAGLVFGWTPGETTRLSGSQNGGVFVGMLLVGILATGLRLGSLKAWVVAGCTGSALALLALSVLGGLAHGSALMSAATVALGFFNGMFAVAAIGSMMALAGQGAGAREGSRMGLWGASQAIAAGFGGLAGAALVDGARAVFPTPTAFALTFALEALLFLAAAAMAARILGQTPSAREGLSRGIPMVHG